MIRFGFRVYKKGYEVAVEKAKNSSEIVNVWIRMINPLMFPSEFGRYRDSDSNTSVIRRKLISAYSTLKL